MSNPDRKPDLDHIIVPRSPLRKSAAATNAPVAQSGVVAYRLNGAQLEVMLVTSSRRRRWTIPKGYVKTGLSAIESAGEEAWEEGGIRGVVSQIPVGRYAYTKRATLMSVAVYSMQVDEVHDDWPEQAKRERRWMSLLAAVAAIDQAGLRDIVARFGAALAAPRAGA